MPLFWSNRQRTDLCMRNNDCGVCSSGKLSIGNLFLTFLYIRYTWVLVFHWNIHNSTNTVLLSRRLKDFTIAWKISEKPTSSTTGPRRCWAWRHSPSPWWSWPPFSSYSWSVWHPALSARYSTLSSGIINWAPPFSVVYGSQIFLSRYMGIILTPLKNVEKKANIYFSFC